MYKEAATEENVQPATTHNDAQLAIGSVPVDVTTTLYLTAEFTYLICF
jgi:hypothetical protein